MPGVEPGIFCLLLTTVRAPTPRRGGGTSFGNFFRRQTPYPLGHTAAPPPRPPNRLGRGARGGSSNVRGAPLAASAGAPPPGQAPG